MRIGGIREDGNAALEFIEAEIGKLKGQTGCLSLTALLSRGIVLNVILIEQQRPQKAGTSHNDRTATEWVWHE